MNSAQFETLKIRWEQGRISEAMLKNYVKAGRITAEEYVMITGKQYSA